jgi:hypothetical protein
MDILQSILDRLINTWPVISQIPDLIVLLVAAAAIAAWWLRGVTGQGQVNGLKAEVGSLIARISVLEERLRLAADKLEITLGEKERLEGQMHELNVQIEDKMPVYALTQTSAAAGSSLKKLGEGLDNISAALKHPLSSAPERGDTRTRKDFPPRSA